MKKANGIVYINGKEIHIFAVAKTFKKIKNFILQSPYYINAPHFDTYWSKDAIGNIGEKYLAESEVEEGVWVADKPGMGCKEFTYHPFPEE